MVDFQAFLKRETTCFLLPSGAKSFRPTFRREAIDSDRISFAESVSIPVISAQKCVIGTRNMLGLKRLFI